MDEEQEAIAAKGAAAALPDNFPLAAKLQEAREGDEDAQADLARYGMWPEMERLDDEDDVVMMEVEGEEAGAGEHAAPQRRTRKIKAWEQLTEDDLEPLGGNEKSIAWHFLRYALRRRSPHRTNNSQPLVEPSRKIPESLVSATGETFYKLKKHVACLLCLTEGKKDPTFSAPPPKFDVSNVKDHVQTQHAAEWQKVERASAPSKGGQRGIGSFFEPSTAAAKPAQPVAKVLQPFELVQRQKIFAACTLLLFLAHNAMTSVLMRTALGAVGGMVSIAGTAGAVSHELAYTPADYRTVRGWETDWAGQCKYNIQQTLAQCSILTPDLLPIPSESPLLSISFDGSSTKIHGYTTFSLNANWLNPLTCIPDHASLGVVRFVMPDGDTSGAGKNVATLVVNMLKEWNIVPLDHNTLDIHQYVYGACTDNASPEIHACVKILKINHQPCICHSLELAIKAAADPPVPASVMKGYQEAVVAAQVAGDPPPRDPRSSLSFALTQLSKLAKFSKVSTLARGFLTAQENDGVQQPLSLVSRSATRWSMAYNMFLRAMYVSSWIGVLYTLAAITPLSQTTTRTAIQSITFLKLFKDAIVACQSRKQLIGSHMLHVNQICESVFTPSVAGFRILNSDLQITAQDLNEGVRVSDLLDDPLTSIPFSTTALLPEVTQLHDRIKEQLTKRLGDDKFQINPKTAGLAAIFDPAAKVLVLDTVDALGNIIPVPNAIYNQTQKMHLVASFIAMGKALEMEMSGTADEAGAAEAPPPKTARAGLLARAAAAAAAAAGGAAAAPRVLDDNTSAFMKEFKSWRARPLEDVEMHTFWASEEARKNYRIMPRLMLSVCSVRPDNAESERDFSALQRLLTPLNKGRFASKTVERKLFLQLNRHFWKPCPELADDSYWKELCSLTGQKTWGEPLAAEGSDSDFE